MSPDIDEEIVTSALKILITTGRNPKIQTQIKTSIKRKMSEKLNVEL